MIRSVLTIITLVLVSSLAAGHSTASAMTLDQSYIAPWSGFADVDSSVSVMQTYTAGVTGNLVQMEVPLTNVNLSGATPDLVVQIVDAKGVSLYSTTINPAGLPNWNVAGSGQCLYTPVSVSVPQTAGTTYGIVLSSNSPLTYGWCMGGVSGYPGGSFYQSSPPGSRWHRVKSHIDLDFQTYVA